MSLSADQKINMSLDDIVKHKISEDKKKPVNSKATNGRNRRQSKPNNGTPQKNGQSPAKSINVNKSVGAAKAKRAANVNQRRGLNQSGKATKADIKTSILKAGQNKRVSRPNSAKTAVGGAAKSLKISFRPKELNKSTDKAVSQQIRAVLSKQPAASARSNNSTPRAASANSGRQVILSTKGLARGNPKSRGNNKR